MKFPAEWSVFPLWPIASDGSCGCGDRSCTDIGKHPCVKWGKNSLGAGVQLHIPEGYGAGIATGARSGFFAIDLDLKDGKDGLAALAALGEVPPTRTTATPTGGYHLKFKHPGFHVPNSASVLGPGIDVRGDGGYVVAPGSRHKNGGIYTLVDPNAPIVDAPSWLLEVLRNGPKKLRKVSRETLERIAKTWKRSKSPMRQELGDALDSVCKGESFAPPGERDDTIFRLTKDLAKALPESDPATIAELFAPSLDLMGRESPDAPTVDVVLEKLARALEEGDGGPWTGRLAASENGIPKACLGNVVLVLENHATCREVLAFDERRQKEVFVKPPPWGGDVPRDVGDEDATRCAVWLTEVQRLTAGADMCRKAMDAIARARRFDHVVEHLQALAWDGVPRIDTWLVDYAGAADTPYVRTVGAKFLIALVARAFRPGCKVDTMLVLEGKQGIGKSSLLCALVGQENFADDLPDIESKDAKDFLQGPWLVEVKELRAFDRKSESALKGFIDQRSDRYRPAYGAKTLDVPRRCCFAGTTNDSEYLRDPTGKRRFWPVLVERCDVAGVAAVRDQLWAEAVARFSAGNGFGEVVANFLWWLDEGQERGAAVEQEQRHEVDPWEERIVSALETGVTKRAFQRADGAPDPWSIPPAAPHVSVAEVLEHVVGILPGQWTRAHEMRVSGILKRQGWIRRFVHKTKSWRYARDPTSARSDGSDQGVGLSQPPGITHH